MLMLTKDDKLVDIIWSPTKEDEFAAYDHDLYLFRIASANTASVAASNVIALGEEARAELIANCGENTNPRLVAWSFSVERPYLFALSLPNHRIQLLGFGAPGRRKGGHEASMDCEIIREFCEWAVYYFVLGCAI